MNQLSTYETAKLAKDAGFDGPCNYYFDPWGNTHEKPAYMSLLENEMLCPQINDLQDWLLEYRIWVQVMASIQESQEGYYVDWIVKVLDLDSHLLLYHNCINDSKDEALEQGIQVALKERIKECTNTKT